MKLKRHIGHWLLRKNANKIYINWTSDVHVSEYIDHPELSGSGVGELKHLYSSGAKLRKFIDYTNSNETDLVMVTGDMVDYAPDFDIFMSYMNQISVRKEYTIGNHDLYQSTLEEVENAVGIGDRISIAGSKFNYSFSLEKDDLSIRIITIDTTNLGDYAGVCDIDTRNFIESELLNCNENIVMLFMHHAPHRYSDLVPQFVEADALALSEMIGEVKAGKGSQFKIAAFFGHSHGNSSVVKYTNLSFDGYLSPALVDGESQNFIRIEITKNGFGFKNINASYPYP